MDTPVTPDALKSALGNDPAPEAAPATPPEGEITPPNPDAKPDDTPPANPPQEHDWKKRFDGVDRDHKHLSEKHGRLVEANVKLVERNPDLLEDLAETDTELADEVSQKIHGKSYAEHKKAVELEIIKDTDPEGYDKEKRLRALEERETQRLDGAKSEFLKSKGIAENQYDPDYQKFQEQLGALKPKFVEDNPARAYEMAHALAFPAKSAGNPGDAALAGNTTPRGGNVTTNVDHRESPLNPQAQAFQGKMRELTTT